MTVILKVKQKTKLSKGNNDFNNWTRGQICDIWANNLVELCPCTDNLPEAESKKLMVHFFGGGNFKKE